jgi:hypothetical protein
MTLFRDATQAGEQGALVAQKGPTAMCGSVSFRDRSPEQPQRRDSGQRSCPLWMSRTEAGAQPLTEASQGPPSPISGLELAAQGLNRRLLVVPRVRGARSHPHGE